MVTSPGYRVQKTQKHLNICILILQKSKIFTLVLNLILANDSRFKLIIYCEGPPK